MNQQFSFDNRPSHGRISGQKDQLTIGIGVSESREFSPDVAAQG